MTIPNADRAVVDIRKFQDYSLNPQHRIGRHKAQLFASLVGMDQKDAEALRDILLDVILTRDARLGELDEHGQRYLLDFELQWREYTAAVRSVWNIPAGLRPISSLIGNTKQAAN